MLNYEEIYVIVKNELSEKRFYHSECVVERCIEFAQKYNVDIEKMKIAAILHDIAKEISNENQIKMAEEYGLKLDEIEKKHIPLIHAKLGAEIAKKDFACSEDICEAIKWHTTGKENMSIMEKILFMADATGKDRSFDNTEYLYKLAKDDLDNAIIELLKKSIPDMMNKNIIIHPDSIKTFNYMISKKIK